MFEVELNGVTYHIYQGDKEFAQAVGRSAGSLSHMTEHPARFKDRGMVYWCLEIWTKNLLGDQLLPAPEHKRDKTPFPSIKDFENKLRIIK